MSKRAVSPSLSPMCASSRLTTPESHAGGGGRREGGRQGKGRKMTGPLVSEKLTSRVLNRTSELTDFQKKSSLSKPKFVESLLLSS